MFDKILNMRLLETPLYYLYGKESLVQLLFHAAS